VSLIGRVSKAVAIGAAKKECELRGWPWKEPIRIERFLSRYYVKTNQSMRGGNVHMTVSARDGTIRSANFVRY
jgi:hypothetical protein